MAAVLVLDERTTELAIDVWDAMIVLAAAESECDVLLAEDLHDGQVLRGVQVRNPFAD